MKIYLINKKRLTEGRSANLNLSEVSDETFIYLSGHTGDRYDPIEFEKLFNDGEIDYNDSVIRFVK